MMQLHRDMIKKAYEEFNARNIDAVLSLMHDDVHWPNGWEGGYVEGHEAVRDYWTRQWKELNPVVKPVSIDERNDGKIEVLVHQLVKDMLGSLIVDGMVKHIYTIDKDLIKEMKIEEQ